MFMLKCINYKHKMEYHVLIAGKSTSEQMRFYTLSETQEEEVEK